MSAEDNSAGDAAIVVDDSGPSVASTAYPAAEAVLRGDITGAGPSESLTHYSTQQGAYGIVTDGAIWATDPRFLNDKHEVDGVRAVWMAAFDSIIQDEQSATIPIDGLSDVAKELRRRLKADSAPIVPENHQIYVACFTGNPDQLSQWRGYGGITGPPYSLTCDTAKLRYLQPARTQRRATDTDDVLWRNEFSADADVSLLQVTYSPTGQEHVAVRALSTYLMSLAQSLAPLRRPRWEAELDTAEGYVKQLMQLHALIVKDDGFKEEAEWRLIITQVETADRPLFRPTPFGYAPYKRLVLPKKLPTSKSDHAYGPLDLLQGVIQGPHAAERQGLESFRRVLDAYGYDGLNFMRTSSIPYRTA